MTRRQFVTGLLLGGLLFARPLLAAPPQGTADEILLGMSTVLSGPAAELGVEMRRGVLAGLERANRNGGIDGRRLRLISMDDGYEPERTAPNMHKLLEQDRVLAIIGNVGTPTAIAALPLIRKNQTLFFAPFSGAGVLRHTPPERFVINLRASYAEEIDAMVQALVEKGGVPPARIAFFTQRDGYGDAGYVGGFASLRRYGLKDDQQVLHVRYRRNTLAVENALADLLLAEPSPRAVILVGTYAPCAKFIRLARQAGLDALFLNVSFVGSAALARELGEAGNGVVITQVVPHPQQSALPLVQAYREDIRKIEGASPSFVSLEGYAAARILVAGLKKADRPLTRSSVIDGLERLGRFDIGLGIPLHISPTEHQASHRVWPTRLENGRIVPASWEEILRDLPTERRP
ncbi:amino acid/amide ABC transporter substrate-binding protein (HAAT family) [Geothermobacter ehrlichii]|uniref:Amino acid/amide ABC transporter substrate-binding protein (HAAT family) n=1 Tax=Geothermobacter ehrlichii TaxID=213224 RepID=A0A5D3WEV1_9BACT|nr:ABC transporter substrate-binding protein [Geothermobacter ehrlichii]TYO95811.1 amino acid/amide ABC transporter substrate-binding protein (HAAT family) [Geothermobacter ehrlichii]